MGCVEAGQEGGLVLWLRIFGPEQHANIYLGTGPTSRFLLWSLFVLAGNWCTVSHPPGGLK